MSNSLDDEQRTKNTRESSAISCSAQLPTRPASACSLFFFPPVQRHTPFSLQIPFCNLCIGSCLFPTLLRPYSTNYFFSLYPSHSSDPSLSVEVSFSQRQEPSLDPHHSCSHLASCISSTDGLSKREYLPPRLLFCSCPH